MQSNQCLASVGQGLPTAQSRQQGKQAQRSPDKPTTLATAAMQSQWKPTCSTSTGTMRGTRSLMCLRMRSATCRRPKHTSREASGVRRGHAARTLKHQAHLHRPPLPSLAARTCKRCCRTFWLICFMRALALIRFSLSRLRLQQAAGRAWVGGNIWQRA